MVADMKLPAFIRAHTEWHPKAHVKGPNLEIRCADAAFTVPNTGDKKADTKAAVEAVRNYAKAHNWAEI